MTTRQHPTSHCKLAQLVKAYACTCEHMLNICCTWTTGGLQSYCFRGVGSECQGLASLALAGSVNGDADVLPTYCPTYCRHAFTMVHHPVSIPFPRHRIRTRHKHKPDHKAKQGMEAPDFETQAAYNQSTGCSRPLVGRKTLHYNMSQLTGRGPQ